MTQDAYGIFADPTVSTRPSAPQIAARLANTLGLNAATVLKNLTKPDTEYVELAHRVPPEQAKLITSLGYRGIGTIPESRRVYPASGVASNLIGFVKQNGDGGGGLEHQYNELLKGVDGISWSRSAGTASTSRWATRRPSGPSRAQGLQLTINQDIQWKAEELLAAEVKKHTGRLGHRDRHDAHGAAPGDGLHADLRPEQLQQGDRGGPQEPGRPGTVRAGQHGQDRHGGGAAGARCGHPGDPVHSCPTAPGATTGSSATPTPTADEVDPVGDHLRVQQRRAR